MIRECVSSDSSRMFFVINDAAKAYEGFIPADCYRSPYMSLSELLAEMRRMTFYGHESEGYLTGVIGLEPAQDVTLIRHAYVLTECQAHGIGSSLLRHLEQEARTKRILVGTWADAVWAIRFYQKHGYSLRADKDDLLRKYWRISDRQIEKSVVLEMSRA